MSFGLDYLDTRGPSDEGAWLHLRHPTTGEPLYREGQPLRLKVAGPDSSLRQRCLTENARRLNRAAQLTPDRTVDPAESARITADAMAPSVLAWEGFVEPFNEANVAELLRAYRWAFEQFDNFGASRAGFLPKTGPASSEPSASASALS